MNTSPSLILSSALVCLLLLGACAKSQFSGSRAAANGSKADADEAPAQETQPAPVDAPCVSGDTIKLNLPPLMQQCMDQGRIFNTTTNVCVEGVQSSGACSFEALKARVLAEGLKGTAIEEAAAAGALLVACGEKNEGHTIIAQWYLTTAGADSCADKNPTSRITTGCFKNYRQGELPSVATKEDQERVVQSCLSE